MEYNNGDIYEGELKDGLAEGHGNLTIDGAEYSGEFKQNTYHGQGAIKYADGTSYRGSFENGEYHGKGTYTVTKNNFLPG